MMDANILLGDCRETLKTIADGSVQTCVTSPPYYGLRDYGTAEWKGGDKNCEHIDSRDRFSYKISDKQKSNLGSGAHKAKDICSKCGAVRIDNQLGLEKTPEEYIQNMVSVFREVWRVLADGGTLWLNLGDSYNGYPANVTRGGNLSGKNQQARHLKESGYGLADKSLKPKDLIGIPWMMAFALRADGWYLRQDIIWHKPNPMPESVTDRCTKAHEYIFLLSKSQKYYYDQDAILEPVSGNTHLRVSQNVAEQIGSERANGGKKTNGNMKAVIRTPKQQPAGNGIKNNDSFNNALVLPVEERNKRSVWTVTTKPYKEAHFATFPPDLIEPCILAGSREGDIVLDPFNGSGTTGAVALKHHRKYIGCELNPKYIELTKRRLAKVQPVLFPLRAE